MEDYKGLITKVERYQTTLANTKAYRERWDAHLRSQITTELENMLKVSKLEGKIEVQDKVRHLEFIVLSLGSEESGISEIINDKTDKPLIKNNGSLVYQQLFNGKVQVMIGYPYIEGFGEPHPPKIIGIYRPEEIKAPFLIRHMEDFIKEITIWEDFDDDDTPAARIGYQMSTLPNVKPSDG
ncbi:MAG TPA: hypothetical protein VFG10_19140 [Saprospiraceae bacterium]|nr:hypothetical protein [Saprospiraceae bacterium]